VYFVINVTSSGFNPPDNVRTTALVNALAEILWQAGGSKSAKLVLYVIERVYLILLFLTILFSYRNPANPKRFKPYKLADWTAASFSTATELQQAIRANISSFTGFYYYFKNLVTEYLLFKSERSGSGVLLFVYSAILSRGISNVRSDMDVSDTPLLAPHVFFFFFFFFFLENLNFI
jgi:hypothetical protein